MGEIDKSDIAKVQRVWANLMKDEANSGVLIVKTFLDRFDYYSSFVRFKDLPREEIEQNKDFRAHCVGVMKGLNAIISNLCYPDKMKEVLQHIGSNHAKRGITEEKFDNLIIVVLDLLKEKSLASEEEIGAWQRVLRYTFSIIQDNL